jgi:hypothetical protein
MKATGGPQGVGVFALRFIPKGTIIYNYRNYATVLDKKGYDACRAESRIWRYSTQRWSKVMQVGMQLPSPWQHLWHVCPVDWEPVL